MHCCDQVKEYIEGGEFQERQEGAARIQRDVKLLEGSRKDHAISTASTIKERFAKMDLEEAEAARQEADEYLGLALKSYLAVLCQGSGNRSQAAVYRLVALWFANAESNPVLLSIPSTLPKVSFFESDKSAHVSGTVLRCLAGSLCLCCTNWRQEWRCHIRGKTTQPQHCSTRYCVALWIILTMPFPSSLPLSMPKRTRSD